MYKGDLVYKKCFLIKIPQFEYISEYIILHVLIETWCL